MGSRDPREQALERAKALADVMASRYLGRATEQTLPADYLAAFKRQGVLDLYPPAKPRPKAPDPPRYPPRLEALNNSASTPALGMLTRPSSGMGASYVSGAMSVGNLTLGAEPPNGRPPAAWTMTALAYEPGQEEDGEGPAAHEQSETTSLATSSHLHWTQLRSAFKVSAATRPIRGRRLREEIPRDWEHPDRHAALLINADRFDGAYTKRSSTAERLYHELRGGVHGGASPVAFKGALFEVYSTRYCAPDAPLVVAVVPPPRLKSRRARSFKAVKVITI